MNAEYPSGAVMEKSAGLLHAFAGVFTLSESASEVRSRVEVAIEDSIAGLPWTLRTLARPLLRRAAHVPEWIRFEGDASALAVVFAGRGMIKEIVLRSLLNGPPTRQRLVPAIAGEVLHARVDERTLRTEILVESGKITNIYELIDRTQLAGSVTITSGQLPKPIEYGMRLCRPNC